MREQLKKEIDIQCAQRYWDYFIEKNDSIISDIFTSQLPIPKKKLYINYIKRQINIYRNESHIEKYILETKSNIKIS